MIFFDFLFLFVQKSTMSLRFNAIENLSASGEPKKVEVPSKITNCFGSHVFTLKTAREYLNDEAFKSLQASIKNNQKIDRNMANQIANGIKAWLKVKVLHISHIGFNHLPVLLPKSMIHFLQSKAMVHPLNNLKVMH